MRLRKQHIAITIFAIICWTCGYFEKEITNFFVSNHSIDGLICAAIAIGIYAIFHFKCEIIKHKERSNSNDKYMNVYHSLGELRSEIQKKDNETAEQIKKMNELILNNYFEKK